MVCYCASLPNSTFGNVMLEPKIGHGKSGSTIEISRCDELGLFVQRAIFRHLLVHRCPTLNQKPVRISANNNTQASHFLNWEQISDVFSTVPQTFRRIGFRCSQWKQIHKKEKNWHLRMVVAIHKLGLIQEMLLWIWIL